MSHNAKNMIKVLSHWQILHMVVSFMFLAPLRQNFYIYLPRYNVRQSNEMKLKLNLTEGKVKA